MWGGGVLVVVCVVVIAFGGVFVLSEVVCVLGEVVFVFVVFVVVFVVVVVGVGVAGVEFSEVCVPVLDRSAIRGITF